MNFGYTILYVENVGAAITFYEQAFGFERRFLMEGQYGEIETGQTRLGFSANAFAKTLTPVGFEPASLAQPAPAMELGFCTEDVAGALAKALAAGATLVKEPEEKPWGQTVAYVRDLDGFLLEICTPMP